MVSAVVLIVGRSGSRLRSNGLLGPSDIFLEFFEQAIASASLNPPELGVTDSSLEEPDGFVKQVERRRCNAELHRTPVRSVNETVFHVFFAGVPGTELVVAVREVLQIADLERLGRYRSGYRPRCGALRSASHVDFHVSGGDDVAVMVRHERKSTSSDGGIDGWPRFNQYGKLPSASIDGSVPHLGRVGVLLACCASDVVRCLYSAEHGLMVVAVENRVRA